MSKKPEAGEWWQLGNGRRKFIVGWAAEGVIVYQSEKDGSPTRNFVDVFDVATHLPDCTGWDWEPEETKPPVSRVTMHRIMIQEPDGEWYQIIRSSIPEWRSDRWHIVETFEVEIPC
jgi:hypothetical protein